MTGAILMQAISLYAVTYNFIQNAIKEQFGICIYMGYSCNLSRIMERLMMIVLAKLLMSALDAGYWAHWL